jgi:hypothetical protein
MRQPEGHVDVTLRRPGLPSLDVTTATVTERKCEGCFGSLPSTARASQHYCDARCRQLALRRRRREQRDRDFAPDRAEAELRSAVEGSTSELRLTALLAKAAQGGSVRAILALLAHYHGWGERTEKPTLPVTAARDESDPFAEIDELRRRRAGQRGA